jgi:hypothetical protein
MLIPQLLQASGTGPYHTWFWFVLAALTTPLVSVLPAVAGGTFICLFWTATLTSASSIKVKRSSKTAPDLVALSSQGTQLTSRRLHRRHSHQLWSRDDGFTLSGPRRT